MSIKPTFAAAILGLLSAFSTAAEEPQLNQMLRAAVESLPPVTGDRIAPDDLTDKVVVVTFFASWCPPCFVEFKHLNELTAEYGDEDLTIIAINVFEDFNDNDTTRLDKFIEKTRPGFFVASGSEATRDAFGGVSRIPTLFIFNRNGEPVMHFIHKRGATKANADVDELRATINKALRQ